jgi:hypothetical protein
VLKLQGLLYNLLPLHPTTARAQPNDTRLCWLVGGWPFHSAVRWQLQHVAAVTLLKSPPDFRSRSGCIMPEALFLVGPLGAFHSYFYNHAHRHRLGKMTDVVITYNGYL